MFLFLSCFWNIQGTDIDWYYACMITNIIYLKRGFVHKLSHDIESKSLLHINFHFYNNYRFYHALEYCPWLPIKVILIKENKRKRWLNWHKHFWPNCKRKQHELTSNEETAVTEHAHTIEKEKVNNNFYFNKSNQLTTVHIKLLQNQKIAKKKKLSEQNYSLQMKSLNFLLHTFVLLSINLEYFYY